MGMEFVNVVIFGLFYAVLISIPLFLLFSVIRSARSSRETNATIKDVKRLLEELIEVQKETNQLLKKE